MTRASTRAPNFSVYFRIMFNFEKRITVSILYDKKDTFYSIACFGRSAAGATDFYRYSGTSYRSEWKCLNQDRLRPGRRFGCADTRNVITIYRNDPIQVDTTKKAVSSTGGVFIYQTKVAPIPKKIYYYVYASCYCDLYGTGKKGYYVFLGPIKKQLKEYELQRHFNRIIREKYLLWAKFNQAEIIENGFVTYREAKKSKNITIHGYETNGFKIHELKW